MKIYQNNFSVFNSQFYAATILAIIVMGLGQFVFAQQIPSAENIINKPTIQEIRVNNSRTLLLSRLNLDFAVRT
ncbi:MAG: hypothetical protein LBF88_07850 [Planctomycetaceae bacterium]|jgi:hypothetical protein|nr:hypothetical protein [Planctomycetaceae bacterium]